MNTLKTFLLMAVLTAIFGSVGEWIGGPEGMILALVIAAMINLFTYWSADRTVLGIYNAQPAGSRLSAITTDLADRQGMPPPKTYVIDDPQPNAFATGRNPSHASVVVSRGLLELLNERELRGVLGHELTHVKNRDTLTMTIAATLAGAISSLSNFALYFGPRGRNRGAGAGTTLLLVLFAPLAAALVQLAISRSREYEADKGGALMCGDPLALAGALEKIEPAARRTENVTAAANPATAPMFIVNPLADNWLFNLFATHPPIGRRIQALRELAANQGML